MARRAEIDQAIRMTLESGRYILGREVEAFEEEFAAFVGARFGVGVGSGTAALRLCLSACGVGKGDEVVTVSHTAVATAAAIVLSGATPVWVDIERDFFTLDPEKIEAAVTPRTRAIVVVHLYGQPAAMPRILNIARARGLRVIEDAAQAHGAMCAGQRVGSFGDAAAFSFYPTKNLGAFGDGGMVTTSNKEMADRVRHLRQYGWDERRISQDIGVNSRLDEVQAAVLRVKLKYLDEDNQKRAALAALYHRLLRPGAVACPMERPDVRHVYHHYVIRSKSRDDLAAFLHQRGVQTLVHYPAPVHLQPAYRAYPARHPLTETETAAREVLSLPMYPELTEQEIRTVAQAVLDYRDRKGGGP